MAVMSMKQFTKEMRIGMLYRKKSLLVKDMFRLFEEYHRTNSENRKLKCLVLLYMYCKHYLAVKPEGKRAAGINRIKSNLALELNSPETRRTLGLKNAGVHYSGGLQRDVGYGGSYVGKELDAAYQLESILPQKNFIQKLRLNFDEAVGSKNYFGMSLLSERIASDKLEELGSVQASEQWAHQMILTSPLTDVLDKLHTLWRDAYAQGDFTYLNAEQRIKYLVIADRGRVVWFRDGSPVTCPTTFGGLAPLPYAMDCDERLYILNEGQIGVTVNHSSILSGHPAVCAGEMEIDNGTLKWVSNNSGHYKPDKHNLADCVEAMVFMGFDPESFGVKEHASDQEWATATQFLNQVSTGGRMLV